MAKLKTHTYKPDPQSGAGNCTCGASEHHRLHPHEFRRWWKATPQGSATQCVCALPLSDPIHGEDKP